MSYFYTNIEKYGNNLLVRGYKDGKRFNTKVAYKPYLFVETPDKNSEFKTLQGNIAHKFDFDSMKDVREFIAKYDHTTNFKLYGLTNFPYTYVYDEFKGNIEFDVKQINIAVLDIEVKSDEGFPEPSLANKEITAITVLRDKTAVVFGCGEFTTDDKNIYYVKCDDEIELIYKFLKFWNNDKWSPDIVTGWNINFDITYLVNRITNILSEDIAKQLSPWKIIKQKEIKGQYGTIHKVYDLYGITILDYIDLYKKFTFKQHPTYRLDYIAHKELGEKKLDYSEYGSLYSLYKENHQLFIEYNIRDCILVQRLEEKLGFIVQVINIAYMSKVMYIDTLKTTRLWDVVIHNYLMDKKIVVPFFDVPEVEEKMPGGFVKDPVVGRHKWIMTFDLTSLYPHLIMMFGISPETLVGKLSDKQFGDLDYIISNLEYLKENNLVCAANYCLYDKGKNGLLPALMQQYFSSRKHYNGLLKDLKKKKEKGEIYDGIDNDISKYHNLQWALKIVLNSAFGALLNKYFRWFSEDNGSAITTSGQMAIQFIADRINEKLNKILKTNNIDYVVYGDTDSVFVSFDKFVQKFFPNDSSEEIVDKLDQVSKNIIEPFISECFEEFSKMVNARQNKLDMKREVISDTTILIAKKRYAMNVRDKEGIRYFPDNIDDPTQDLKVQGIESVRSSTPDICRAEIEEALKIMLRKDNANLIKHISDFKEKFMSSPIEDIAMPVSCNGLKKYLDTSDKNSIFIFDEDDEDENIDSYKKGTPSQVKGAFNYNNLIKKMNLENKYPLIKDGEKIKRIGLKMPNPIHDKILSISTVLPEEFNLEKYVDKEDQFFKTFLKPVSKIADIIDWKTDNRRTIDELWS